MKSPFSVYQQAVHTWFGCSFVGPAHIPEDASPGMIFCYAGSTYQIETREDRLAIATEQTQYLMAAQALHPRLLIQALEHTFPPGKIPSTAFSMALMHVVCDQSQADPEEVVPRLMRAQELLRERQGQPTLWIAFAEIDAGITAAGVVAVERSGALPPGELAEYLVDVCFAHGQEYLTQTKGGLFVQLRVAETDVVIYEVERSDSTAFLAS